MCNCNYTLAEFKALPKNIQDEVNKKLRLEASFDRDIRPFFRKIRDEFKVVFASTGNQPNLNSFQNELSNILLIHYTRCQRQFRGLVKTENSNKFLKPYKATKNEARKEELFEKALLVWKSKRAPRMAENIIETTQSDIDKFIERARQRLIAQEEAVTPSNIEVANVAAVELTRSLANRIGNISITETQAATESTKQLEGEALAGFLPFALIGENEAPPIDEPIKLDSDKEWVTVGDDKVRPAHQQANGQKVKLDEPFEVDGELLNHPGDPSLGATLKNLARCRCASRINIKG